VKPRRAFTIVLPALALLFVGCGGGEDSTESQPTTTQTTTALTKAELIERGDAICAEVNAAVGTVGASSAETSAPATQAAGLYSGMVASLENLGAPEEAEGYPEFVAAAEALATAEDEVKLAAEREDSTTLVTAESKASSALSSFQAAAGEYGFEDCSEGPKPPSGGAAPESEPGGAEAPGSEAEVEETPEAVEEAPEAAPETGGAGGGTEGGGAGGGSSGGGSSGGIGPG
jgi:hypothetical protein